MDDHFRVAEPIPGVYYQGFVMGLQAVSRNGLAAREELQHFDQQVDAFAQLMDGKSFAYRLGRVHRSCTSSRPILCAC